MKWSALKKTARADVAMAERGQGGIFVFVRDAKDVANKFESRLESYWGLRLGDISSAILIMEFNNICQLFQIIGSMTIICRL